MHIDRTTKLTFHGDQTGEAMAPFNRGCAITTSALGDFGGPSVKGFYKESCPLAEEIVKHNVEVAVLRDPRMAASLLRLQFHDCFVLGCDPYVLLDTHGDILSEKQATPNVNSLRGFEVIDYIKFLLEEACPLTVSCSDIIAMAARDSVFLVISPLTPLSDQLSLNAKGLCFANKLMRRSSAKRESSFLEQLILLVAGAALSSLALYVCTGQFDPNRDAAKKALKHKRELAKRLDPFIKTNQYEDVIACDVINPQNIDVSKVKSVNHPLNH